MKELSNLIKKEFLPILSSYGFVSHKNNLLINPINDLLKGFSFDRHDNRLYVHLFIQPLYIPASHLNLGYGYRLKGTHNLGEMFLLDEDTLESTKEEIKKLLLLEKDILLSTNTILDFYNTFLISNIKLLVYKTDIDIRYQETLTLTKSYLYPEEACVLIEQFLKKWEKDDRKEIAWMQDIKNNMLLLKESCSSKESVYSLLAGWRNFSLAQLKLLKADNNKSTL